MPNRIIGVGFPLDRENMVEGNTRVKDQLKSDLLMLMLTEPGERIHLLNYGVGIKGLLFEQAEEESIQQNLTTRINKKLQLFLPQVQILKTETSINKNEKTPHSVSVKIQFIYNIDNTIDSLQLNFKK